MQPPATIELVSLDFDGTILSYDVPDGVLHPEIIALLNEIEPHGVRWCANSGRDFPDQREVVERSRMRGLKHLPVAYICREATVHLRDGQNHRPLEPWNELAHRRLRECHAVVRERLGAQIDKIRDDYDPLLCVVDELATAFLVRDHQVAARSLFRELEQALSGLDDVLLSLNGGWVAVNHRDLGKGNALKEFARHAGVKRERILAIGDHHNDLTMLTGEAAGFVGCPGDAITEVQETVTRAGGRVAQLPGPLGTAEIIRALTRPLPGDRHFIAAS